MADSNAIGTQDNVVGATTSTSSPAKPDNSVDPGVLLKKAKTHYTKETHLQISKEDSHIGSDLKAGKGLQKFLADCESLNDWCDIMLSDKNIQKAITNNLDTVNTQKKEDSTRSPDPDKSEEIKKAINDIGEQLYIGLNMLQKRFLTQDQITKILKTLFVHDAIQNIREKKLDQTPTAQQVAQEEDTSLKKAWYAFNNVLNPIVFRRYRMNTKNLKAITSHLTMPDSLSSIIEDFFNQEKAALECSINGEFISKPLAESTEEVLGASEEPRKEPLDKNVSNDVIATYYTSDLDSSDKQTVLDQLNEASVIALLNTAIVVKLSAKDEEKQHPSTRIGQDTQQKKQRRKKVITKMYKVLKKLQCSTKKEATVTQHNHKRGQMLSEQLQEDNSEELKKELIQKVEANTSLSKPEKEAQKNALTRIMGRDKNVCRIKNSEFFTGEQVTEMQQQALKNAQTYLEQRLYALNGELSKRNNTACASIIDSMVSVAEKIDQTTKTIGKEMHQNVSTWQKTLFPQDSSSTEANGMNNEINNEINKLLIDIESIASQRTYNSCLETLKTLKSTITADPTAKQVVQAKVLAAALSKQIAQAEKKGPFRQFLDCLWKLLKITQKLTLETLGDSKQRDRWSPKRTTHKESRIVEHLKTISEQLDSTQSHALHLQQPKEPKPDKVRKVSKKNK